jgi:hypothetical protein
MHAPCCGLLGDSSVTLVNTLLLGNRFTARAYAKVIPPLASGVYGLADHRMVARSFNAGCRAGSVSPIRYLASSLDLHADIVAWLAQRSSVSLPPVWPTVMGRPLVSASSRSERSWGKPRSDEVVLHARHFDVDVDAVHQRAGAMS